MLAAVTMILGVVLIEGICLFGRFVLKRTGTQMRPTFEWRTVRIGIHHGIIGALAIAVYGVSQLPEEIRFWGLLIMGLILLVSDLIHHCLLKLMYGDWDPKYASLKRRS